MATQRVTVDFFSMDHANDEFVLYLVESGPWPKKKLRARMTAIQGRVYGAVDVVLDGYLAKVHPESRGKRVRIQVDLRDNVPPPVAELVKQIAEYVEASEEYQSQIGPNREVAALRILPRVVNEIESIS